MLDLREPEVLLAVAEELYFGRAAARLRSRTSRLFADLVAAFEARYAGIRFTLDEMEVADPHIRELGHDVDLLVTWRSVRVVPDRVVGAVVDNQPVRPRDQPGTAAHRALPRLDRGDSRLADPVHVANGPSAVRRRDRAGHHTGRSAVAGVEPALSVLDVGRKVATDRLVYLTVAGAREFQFANKVTFVPVPDLPR